MPFTYTLACRPGGAGRDSSPTLLYSWKNVTYFVAVPTMPEGGGEGKWRMGGRGKSCSIMGGGREEGGWGTEQAGT